MKNRHLFTVIAAMVLLSGATMTGCEVFKKISQKSSATIESGPSLAMSEPLTTVFFNDQDAFVQKTYLVVARSKDDKNTPPKAKWGSGFLYEDSHSQKKYFVTAAHVVSHDKVFLGNVSFIDYKGNAFDVELLIKNDKHDIALFSLKEFSDNSVLSETIIHKIGSAKIEETVITCGNMMLETVAFPTALEKTLKGVIVVSFINESGKADELIYMVVHSGIEFGFSGGPTMNKKGELVGVNVMVTKAGQFGILVGGQQNLSHMINFYEKNKKS